MSKKMLQDTLNAEATIDDDIVQDDDFEEDESRVATSQQASGASYNLQHLNEGNVVMNSTLDNDFLKQISLISSMMESFLKLAEFVANYTHNAEATNHDIVQDDNFEEDESHVATSQEAPGVEAEPSRNLQNLNEDDVVMNSTMDNVFFKQVFLISFIDEIMFEMH